MNTNKVINDIFKIVLNILLAIIALGAIITGVSKQMEIGSVCCHLALAIACITAIFNKKYRYILASIALLLFIISYLL